MRRRWSSKWVSDWVSIFSGSCFRSSLYSLSAFLSLLPFECFGPGTKTTGSPRLTVPARVAAKRTEVSHHHHTNAGHNAGFGMTSVTRYYATFEFESGDRMELAVDASEYGLLAEGDVGRLRFQGTRFLAFERNI